MNAEQIERVFGRGRLKMVTGEHVEVFREAVARGERRRYTKRFLNTREGDFGQWTEREWRILARLIGHGIACVPDVVQFDRGRVGGMQLVQTYDAGVTADQWATLLPVSRDGRVARHVFEDCAHWWALAHHCLRALNEIHSLELIHLDVKGDNVCIPYAPASFDPDSPELWLRPVFSQLALIDFAFALVSREQLDTPLPIGWQKEYDYQSPRLLAALEAGRDGELQATRELDWRCDMYSLAAMLKRYLPDDGALRQAEQAAGWDPERFEAAKALILAIREAHDAELPGDPVERPHRTLLELTARRLREEDLQLSLERGWTLAREASVSTSSSPTTPVTRVVPITPLATPIHVARSGRVTAVTVIAPSVAPPAQQAVAALAPAHTEARPPRRVRRAAAVAVIVALGALGAGAALWSLGDRAPRLRDALQAAVAPVRSAADSAKDEMMRRQEAAPATTRSSAPAPLVRTAPDSSPPPRVTAAASSASAPPPIVQRPPAPAASFQRAPASFPASTPASPTVAAPRYPVPSLSTEANAPSSANGQTSPAQAGSTPINSQSASSAPQTRSSAPAPRAHASWAALEPPAWSRSSYRGPGPGEPPGRKTAETHAPQLAASADAPSARPEPSTASTASAQAASSSAQTARTNAVAADAQHPSVNVTTAPAQVQQISAPVEDRSDTLSLAFAQPAVDVRNRANGAEREDEFAVQGRRTLLDSVPRVARQSEPEIARILAMAASAYRQTQERAVADAARTARVHGEISLPAPMTSASEGRRLNDQARAAFSSGRNALDAFELQIRAFGANPQDPEIAGSLALLYLKLTPPQPDKARQIALVALAARGPQYRSTRMEDWNTFAVASALAGREADAKNALYVMLALAGSAEPACVAALNAISNYGAQLRGPGEALLYRVHAQGRSLDSPWCAWPPTGSTPPRVVWPGYSQAWRESVPR
jgi:hypothetical protein